MRIIGGTHRSRRLLPPGGTGTTRPITDRARQSLFDRLWDLGLLGDPDAALPVLDLFCGTGTLGLEALSRGAASCLFVESDRDARRRLDQNLRTLDLADRAMVHGGDALTMLWTNLLPPEPLGVAFCDPPYRLTRDPDGAARVAVLVGDLAPLMADGGVLMLRTDTHTTPPVAAAWEGPVSRRYATTVLHLYQRPLAPMP